MKNGKFEVGDKVRCVKNVCGSWGDSYVGCEGVVEHVTRPSDFPYSVRFVDGRLGDCWPTEIELIVEPARKFAVGDKVRVIADQSRCRRETVGKTGVVREYTAYRHDKYRWSVDLDDGTWVPCSDEELELVESSTASTASTASTPATQSCEATCGTSTVEGVTRVVGAETDETRFLRTGDLIDVRVMIDEENAYSVTMTLSQFNEVYRILNEEGNA